MSELLHFGHIERHVKKAVKIYRERRDAMYDLLQKELSNKLEIHKPEGGMGMWCTYKSVSTYQKLLDKSSECEIIIEKLLPEGIRIGFASVNNREMKKRVAYLKELLT